MKKPMTMKKGRSEKMTLRCGKYLVSSYKTFLVSQFLETPLSPIPKKSPHSNENSLL